MSWEDEDWEKAEIAPIVAPKITSSAAPATKGAALLAQYDASKFEGEDEEPEEDKKHAIPSSQPKKDKKVIGADKEHLGMQEAPLSDPLAEKLRQQRLVEQSDLAAARDLFGTSGSSPLDNFVPKTKEDYEKFGEMVALHYIVQYRSLPGSHYKPLLKSLLQSALVGCTAGDIKDLSQFLGKMQEDRLREEAAAKQAATGAAKKTAGKKALNVGKANLTAGLDELIYEDEGGDDYDFM